MTYEKKRILVVDDETDILQLLEISLNRMGLSVHTAENVGAAKYQLEKTSFHLCLTDFKLPDGTGVDLVKHITQHYPLTPVAVITAFGTINHAVEALKQGAYDFITKPISLDTLRQLIISGLKLAESQKVDDFEPLLFNSTSNYFQALNRSIESLAGNKAPVMIYGDEGTWKEKIAHMIHVNSKLREYPFTVIDCGSKDVNLRYAEKGTTYYKNVEKLDSYQQGALVDQLRQVGDEQRIIAATCWIEAEFKESQAIKKSLIRQLTVGEITTTPLLRRKNDLVELSKEVLEQLAQTWNKLPCKIHPSAMAKLKNYDFPGNIKELDRILSKAAMSCQNQLIREDDIDLSGTGYRPLITKEHNLDQYIEQIEVREITNALAKTHNNKTKAAELLGISFRALRYKIKKLDIENADI